MYMIMLYVPHLTDWVLCPPNDGETPEEYDQRIRSRADDGLIPVYFDADRPVSAQAVPGAPRSVVLCMRDPKGQWQQSTERYATLGRATHALQEWLQQFAEHPQGIPPLVVSGSNESPTF